MAGMVYGWSTITKVEDQPDGTVIVHGRMASTDLDRDRQRFSQAWLDKAVPAWFSESGNVREQHDSKRAAGSAIAVERHPSGGWLLTAHVVDPVAATKVRHQVYKGFSIGVKNPHVTYGKADAPGGEIDGGIICETSLVDRPSNPTTVFTIVKADRSGRRVYPAEDRRQRLARLAGQQRAALLGSIPDELLAGLADGSVLERLEKADVLFAQADGARRHDPGLSEGYRVRAAAALAEPLPPAPVRLWGRERAEAEAEYRRLSARADQLRNTDRALAEGYEQRARAIRRELEG